MILHIQVGSNYHHGDHPNTYSIDAMHWGTIELEPEVAEWLEGLPEAEWAQALFHLDLLETRGVNLGFPYTSQLDGKLRELRFYCGGRRVRITYFITSMRRIIMLTVFHKTSPRESAEIRRATRAMRSCVEAGHTVEEEDV